MKILTVVSGIDFINYTRRATIESIHRLNADLDLLFFNSVKNLFRRKSLPGNIRSIFYYFWILEKLRSIRILPILEHSIRKVKWKRIFSRYELIFLIDPNQYFLLPYISENQKLIYLLRDPSVLMDSRNYEKELPIIKRADAILGVSSNLCSYYFEKYYGFVPPTCHVWPNTVDLNLWNFNKWKDFRKKKDRPIAGLAGNLTYVIDIELLIYVAVRLPEVDFELAGKIDLNESEQKLLDKLLELPNARHLGLISFDTFPSVVMNWDIGLVAAKPDHEFALYLNNNKQYQYLALGKPFVTYRLNADYEDFGDMVLIADNRDDYVNKIRSALIIAADESKIQAGLNIAQRHSADQRAFEFINIAKKL